MGAMSQEQEAQLEGQIHREGSPYYDQTLRRGIGKGCGLTNLVKSFGCSTECPGIERRPGRHGSGDLGVSSVQRVKKMPLGDWLWAEGIHRRWPG